MFERLPRTGEGANPVTVTINGAPVAVPGGDTVAAALLLHGRIAFRISPTAARPRGPYCMMGVCFECLVTIDGIPNRQACMTRVADGMDIKTDTGGSPDDR